MGTEKIANNKLRVTNDRLWTINEIPSSTSCHLFTIFRQSFANHSLLLAIIISMLVAMVGCRRYNTQQPEQGVELQERQQKEALLRINQQLVEKDTKTIETFIERNNWQMQTTHSGLWYMIYRHGQGDKAITGRIATLAYTVSLLDSTVCYSSEQSGNKTFHLGEGGVESGLEEGVLLMHVGDKARLIMPPHLAYGLTGDGNCIPKRAIILYDIELLELK